MATGRTRRIQFQKYDFLLLQGGDLILLIHQMLILKMVRALLQLRKKDVGNYSKHSGVVANPEYHHLDQLDSYIGPSNQLYCYDGNLRKP
jgi:hypothetical protein